MVLADMHVTPGEAWEYCPREALRRVAKVLKDEFNLVCSFSIAETMCFCLISNFFCSGYECRFWKWIFHLKECRKVCLLTCKFSHVFCENFIDEELYREGNEEWVPFDKTLYCSASAVDAAFPVLNEAILALKSLNITVEQVNRKSFLPS